MLKKYNNKKSSQNSKSKLLKSKVVEYDDYDPMTMQSDMPSRNDLDSGEADGQANNGNLNPSILEKFNLTREDLLALSTKMQNNGKSGSNGRLDFTTNGRAETEGTQQDASITMSPQPLREVFNLTVNGDGKVQYDRNLTEEELAERAKQLALQQIKKSMLTYFVHSGTQSGTKVADQTQLERERPANLNRKPIQQRHISEAHRVFLSHAQQMQDQPSDMSLSRNNADIDMLSSTFTEKNIAFHPRCELPKNTDAESWNDSDALNLLFNVSSSIRPEKPNLTLETATLRIYIISPDSANSKHRSRNDDQIRISVSWYTRSLKKQRVKRKLSDSKMVHSSFTGWIELNLKGAVSSWKTTARNHGIAITVEDQEGNALRADSYIQKHDCANLYPRPFPWLVHKKLPYDDTDISYRFPRLDILTRELVDYNYQGLPSLVENIHNAPSAHQAGL
ncbi:uncharacterized protein LOC113370948 [Ctenocephalides felis]|uniref:uncharacterized protein LOC113370948 n=1 Tax=Ctenocephalides felis TaxID=7515 RepID=UPI000E6E22CB|nr:uncharacterized protein LOC113370948 [Ctenocephalides felis]